jgi:hypothetical protein
MSIKIAGVYFAYNRPELIEKTLRKFSNFDFDKLIIFLNGPVDQKDEFKTERTLSEVKKILKNKKNVELNVNKKNKNINLQFFDSLNYVFNKYEAAVVLEDDAIPSETFYNFCKTIINFHKKDDKVAAISGTNYLNIKISEDYYYTKYFFPWGWASWRRFWKSISIKKNDIQHFQNSKKYNMIFSNSVEKNYWRNIFYDKNFDIPWDNYVFMNIIQQGKFTVIPKHNLIHNIGVGHKSSHYQSDYDTRLIKKNFEIKKIIKINKNIFSNIDVDNQIFNIAYNGERMAINNNLSKLFFYYSKNFVRIIKKYISMYLGIRL